MQPYWWIGHLLCNWVISLKHLWDDNRSWWSPDLFWMNWCVQLLYVCRNVYWWTYFLWSGIFYFFFKGLKTSVDFVLLTEFTGKTYRATIGIASFYFWAIGLLICALLGYLLPYWRHYLLVTAVAATPLLFICW